MAICYEIHIVADWDFSECCQCTKLQLWLNQGGVAVRLDFHNTSLCFVCSHLAAHQTEVDRRNQDYQQIMTGLQQEFISRGLKINDTTDRNRTLGCDQVVWVGDLNYRLNELDASDVKTSLHSGKYQQLFLYDQVWPLTPFFLFPFCEISLICLEGKSMTPSPGSFL